jgi:dolichol-phosphate mannosyltransferase
MGSMSSLDIIIPVYNEGSNIINVLESLRASVETPFRVLVCYDNDRDDTLPVLRTYKNATFDILLVKNRGVGVHAAVMSGFQVSTAPAVLVFPADDTNNSSIIDRMIQKFEEGCDVVTASRFVEGGGMEGCPRLKSVLVRLCAFTLYHFARLPTRDATNGLRLFSRKVLETIDIESREGFSYSLELLVKCYRLGWKTGEVPSLWLERGNGASRFRVVRWIPAYLRWYLYAFATTYFCRATRTVKGVPCSTS